MNDSGGRSARIFGDNEGCRINIPTMLHPFLSLSLSLSLSLCLFRVLRDDDDDGDDDGDRAFGPRRLVRQIAIATASLIIGSRVLGATFHPRVPRRTEGLHASGTPGTVVTNSSGIAHSCPAISGRAVVPDLFLNP